MIFVMYPHTMDALGAIVGPPISTVESVEVLNIAVEPFLGEVASILLESEVRKDSEPQPIGIGHTRQVRLHVSLGEGA